MHTTKLKGLLLTQNPFKCACGGEEHYRVKNYQRRCKSCKAKRFVTYGTIFHNIKFGLLKAYKIAEYSYKRQYQVSIAEVATKFGVTRKTASSFLEKLNENQNEVRKWIIIGEANKKERAMLNYMLESGREL